MQKRRNDVKARTTLLLALPDEHQLRFSRYETSQEMWEAILKTFGGNKATKKTKKNQLKQQYGNFKAEDDLNQKYLTSLAPEWLMYTIVWRNRDDLDTMSLDDVYNHLKVYEPEVQKKSESNSHNMDFISLSNTSNGKGKVHTASVLTASIQVSTVSTDVAAASLSYDTIDAQVAREMEEEIARENQRLSEQLTRDSKIARLHAKKELKMMIEGLDRSNDVIAKHLQEYEQAAADLSIGEKIELINELEQKEFYMSLLRSHVGWKTKHFRGMTLEEIKEKCIPVWKQLEDFVPMSSKEEGKRIKRKGLKLDQGSAKKMKTSEDVSEEDLKGMMQLVPLEEVYVEALQVKHPIINLEIHSEGQREYWKIIRLGGHIAVYQFFVDMLKQFDREDLHQLWILEMFMLVEKDYLLRKGLATVMICNNLQVEQYSQMANDLILKIHNIENSPR
nr:ribonuclease H-like domain-containing protein [Tanacetum cinerariifolium]